MKPALKFMEIIFLFLMMQFFISCSEDFLTKEPYGAAAGSVMNSPDGLEAVLASTYQAMKGRSIFGSSMGVDWIYGSVASDDCCLSPESASIAYHSLERWEQYSPYSPYLRERWRDCYNGVVAANLVLDLLRENQNSPEPVSEQRANEIEGEAKFLRAWFHFQANKIFENIPYIKTQIELGDVKPEQVPNISPCWDEIEKDLQDAINLLPVTRPKGQVGRAHKYSAMAVKAQAHMYQNEFAEARPLLDAILNSGQFSLVDEYGWNYDMTHENNSESIFELQCSTTSTGHTSMLLAIAVKHCWKSSVSFGGWGLYQPSQSLFEAFQVGDDGLPVLDPAMRDSLSNDIRHEGNDVFYPTEHLLDPRVDYTIARRGVDYNGWGIHPGEPWMRSPSYGGPFMTKKFMQSKSEHPLCLYGIGAFNGINFRLYRLSHIILWRAEVAVEDGQLDYARRLVNMIRERARRTTPVMGRCMSYANLLSNPVVDWNQPAANYKVEPYPEGHLAFSCKEEARKAVREEIRLEFATEGHRFFDLRRWGIIEQVLNDFVQRDIRISRSMQGAVFNEDQNDYWPLPQDQVDLQKGVLKQDPAYIKKP
ncbi:MAG: RagB/SusD family nutrient uptake outer membrane protein [Bacteroidales bacterium]